MRILSWVEVWVLASHSSFIKGERHRVREIDLYIEEIMAQNSNNCFTLRCLESPINFGLIQAYDLTFPEFDKVPGR